jgi:hypothetical protein
LADDDVSSLIAGKFSGDAHMDAIVLANGKPVLRSTVEVYQSYILDNVPAVDIAALKGTGANGRDQAVVVGSGGLTKIEYASAGWINTNLRGTGTYWASALAVRTGQVDGLNGDDIVAVTSNRVLIAKSDGSGGWMTDVSFLAGSNITGVELVDWDGAAGGALEIAVLIGSNSSGAARVRLVRPNGTLITTIPTTADVIVASPIATSAAGPRWLAAVSTTFATGAQDFVLLSSSAVAGPWSLGAAGIYDTASGDWNGDGVDDVVLATNTDRDAWLYRFESSGGTLGLSSATPAGSPIQLPVGHPDRPLGVQDGRMDIADVDHDGDRDLIAAVQGNWQNAFWTHADPRFSDVVVTRNNTVDHFLEMPWRIPSTPWPDGFTAGELDLETGDLTVRLLTPSTVLPGAQYQYVVWHTASIETAVDSTPLIPPTTLDVGLEGANGPTWSTITIPTDQHEVLFPDRYTLIARQVVTSGGTTQYGPALDATFFSALYQAELSSDWRIRTLDDVQIFGSNDLASVGTGAMPPPLPAGQEPPP